MPSSRQSGRIAPGAKRSVTRRLHDRLSRLLTPESAKSWRWSLRDAPTPKLRL